MFWYYLINFHRYVRPVRVVLVRGRHVHDAVRDVRALCAAVLLRTPRAARAGLVLAGLTARQGQVSTADERVRVVPDDESAPSPPTRLSELSTVSLVPSRSSAFKRLSLTCSRAHCSSLIRRAYSFPFIGCIMTALELPVSCLLFYTLCTVFSLAFRVYFRPLYELFFNQ